MTSSDPASPTIQNLRNVRLKSNHRSADSFSSCESSPERVTWQNQLLQPVLLLSRPSKSSSEVNIEERQKTVPSEACSISDNAFAQAEEMSHKITQLKETNNKRMKWFKLIRLQLNTLHERKMENANVGRPTVGTKQSELESPNSCKENQRSPIASNQAQDSVPPPPPPPSPSSSQIIKGISACPVVTTDTRSSPTADSVSKNMQFGKKRTTNVRGRISHFWRHAAAAALKHQKQTMEEEEEKEEEAANKTLYSTASSSVEPTAQRFLMTTFQHSWPSLQQVISWQHSFQNLLQDNDGLVVFQGFLQGEFSDENLEFWIACQKYKSLTDKALQRLRAQEIYNSFMAFQSQREVNLDCETRIQTEKRVSRGESDLFDASQKRIEALMEKDPYRRFLRSTLYLKLVEICQGRDVSSSTGTFNESDTVEPQMALPIPQTSATAHSSP